MNLQENSNSRNHQKFIVFITRFRLPFRITFILTGIASTIWFLVKVIPKPSRATYPCMQAAAPIMSGFIVWLIGLFSSALAFKKAKTWFRKSRFLPALVFTVVAVIFCLMLSFHVHTRSSALPFISQAEHEANNPMGEAQGIFPGRVVWAWDPAATNQNCTNSWGARTNPNDDDGYFLPQNNNQSVIDSMLTTSVLHLTGESTVENAWNALFRYHNQKKGSGDITYIPGQTIFIKINQGSGDWMSDPSDLSISTDNEWRAPYYGITETLPQLILSVLKHLVDSCGIPQDKIYIGDPRAHIFKHNYDYLAAVYPDIKYFDQSYSTLGRTKSAGPGTTVLTYSDKGTIMSQAVTDHLYQEMENADYLINMACLKGHQRAGITLTAKNHFGSHTRSSASHLHAGLVWVEAADWGGNYTLMRTNYGMYRVQVDLMGYKYLGENTMLFMVDGLWGGPEATMKPVKWKTTPFNNDWSSSLFISQDQVALESVCFDFLRTEFTETNHPGLAFPNYPATDDYLHQAADSSNWPEGIVYDPENDGIPIGSLGTHEHWNDPLKKQYSRNLGMDYGIELYAPGLVNNVPKLTVSLRDIVIHKNSKPVYLVHDLREIFSDSDGDDLTFSVSPSNNDEVNAILDGDTAIIIQSGNDFTGFSEITITASDGTDEISETVQIKVVDKTQMAATRTDEAITFDGVANESVWENSRWYYIDQVWIPYRASLPANDFSGRYKVAWSEDANVIYFFAETTDDVFVDGYVYNSDPSIGGNYPAYDILEVFIDEDKSGGNHVFDDVMAGENAENAFSYHIAISQPADGETTSSVVVCDIAGTNWNSYSIPNYADHLDNFIVRRNGNILSWEFSLKVYNDTYDDENPENSRVTLTTGKQIGLSLAYCDNDNPNEDPKTRDNFIGSDVGPDQSLTEWNEHWMNASVYGNLKLDDDQPNRPPEVTGTINDFQIFELNIPYMATANLNEIFSDPDGDQLIYTGLTSDPALTVDIQNDTVVMVTLVNFLAGGVVTIRANDGDYSTSTQFTVNGFVDNVKESLTMYGIDIWPNPVYSTMGITINNNILGLVEIHVMDLSGKLVSERLEFKTSQMEEYKLDLTGLKPGLYLVQVKQGSYCSVKKIVHQ
jgi:hypothetical protein